MKRLIILTLLLLACTSLYASDAYFIRFGTAGETAWRDDILFFNTNATPVSVRFVGVSNGSLQTDTPPLLLAPGQTTALNSNFVATLWLPLPVTNLWILHLDVPGGVIVESRDEFYVVPAIPELLPIPMGKVSMPVFHRLAASNEQQVHLGTDLSGADSRINVGIYNSGSAQATARIEVRRSCDDVAIDTRTVEIPPNTVIQVGGFTAAPSSLCTAQHAPPWMRDIIVVVDQPSLTFVSNLNTGLCGAPSLLPTIGLAVSANQQF